MTECLSEEQIDDFLSDCLSNADEQRLDNHLQDCAACRELLNEKTAVPESIRQALGPRTKDEDQQLDSLVEIVCGLSSVGTDSDRILVQDPKRPGVEHTTRDVDTTLPVGDRPTLTLRATAAQSGSAPSSQPVELPGYEIIEEIGRGGLGVVFKARQLALGRLVAVKMMLPHTFPGREELARFRIEAESVAKLQHPNVVQVFDVIDQADNPCICMEYVEGDDLSALIGEDPQPPDTAARLVELLAHAIHVVHEAGILHRDLKPANILLAASGDPEHGVLLVARDGSSEYVQPKISDFGLAKQVDKESELTKAATALGTPGYMSPEQAREGKSVTQATDVYSLGAILYKLLVGRPPLRGSSAVDTMAQVIHTEPVPPSRLVGAIPTDLEAVCLKCLEKDPRRRYESAAALADDLKRVQQRQPTIARPITGAERFWRLCRRNPVVTSLAMLALVLLVAGTVVSATFAIQASQLAVEEKRQRELADQKTKEAIKSEQAARSSEQKAREEKDHARQEQRRANDLTYSSGMRLLQFYLESGNRDAAEHQLAVLEKINDGIDRRGFEWDYWLNLLRQEDNALRLRVRGGTTGVLHPVFSSDRKLLASVDEDGSLFIWDAEAASLTHKISAHEGAIAAIRFNGDGTRLATLGSEDHIAKVWDTTTGEIQSTLAKNRSLRNVWFDEQGRALAAVRRQNSVMVLNVSTGQHEFDLAGIDGVAAKVIVVADGLLLVDLKAEDLQLFDATTGEKIRSLSRSGIQKPLECAGVSPDRELVAAAIDSRIHVWSLETGQLLHVLPTHKHSFNTLCFTPNNHQIVSLDTDQGIRVWAPGGDYASFVPQRTLLVGRHSGLTISTDGERLAAGASYSGVIKIWDTASFSSHERIDLDDRYHEADFSSSPERVAFRHRSGELEVVDWNTRETIFRSLPDRPVSNMAFSPGGHRLAAHLQESDEFLIWDLRSPDAEPVVVAATAHMGQAVFSPLGEMLAVLKPEGVLVWDAATGTELRTFQGHSARCTCAAFHPDGTAVASGAMNVEHLRESGRRIEDRANEDYDSSILLWDVQTGEVIADLSRGNTAVRNLSFDSSGNILASASKNFVDLYDIETRSLVRTLTGHTKDVLGMSFSPDGRRLATASADKTVRIWDVGSGEMLLTFRGHEGRVRRVAFSSDGQTLFSESAKNQLIVWQAPKERLESTPTQ